MTSVVIDNLDVGRTCRCPAEANAILVVHANAVLAGAVPFERLQPIARRYSQVGQVRRDLQLSQLAPRNRLNAVEAANAPSGRQRFRAGIAEGDDHRYILTPRVINVKRGYLRTRP